MCRLATLIAFSWLAQASYAQLPGGMPTPTTAKAPAPEKPKEQDRYGRDTPRGCVVGFLKAVELEDYSQAVQYLNVRVAPSQAQELARELQVVLNRGLSGKLDNLSRAPEGDLKDNLPDNRELVGSVKTTFGKVDILLDRVQRNTGPPIWLFSSETLDEIPWAFEELSATGIEKYVPRTLKQIKFLSIPLWRWFVIILSLALVWVSASLLTRALIPLLRPLLRRITRQEDDRYPRSLKQPIRLILLALAIRLLAGGGHSVLARNFWTEFSNIIALVGFSWLLIKFSDVVSDLSLRQLLRRQATGQIAVLALVRRSFKMLVLFVAILLLLRGAGVNVSSMLAGLGIGGIALALAAQKTLEDFFGGIAIITRKSVRVGDFCQLADQLGMIEDIGLGSTRVRTLGRTVVSIQNAKVSQLNLENYSMRDKIWFHHIFGLRYDTSPGQMRQILRQVTEMLRADPRVEADSARIRLLGIAASSLSLELFAYIRITDYTAFLEVQEDLLLRIMDIIEANGTSISLPAQLTYLDRDKWSSLNNEWLVTDTGDAEQRPRSAETFRKA